MLLAACGGDALILFCRMRDFGSRQSYGAARHWRDRNGSAYDGADADARTDSGSDERADTGSDRSTDAGSD